jgi:hypothetical protein
LHYTDRRPDAYVRIPFITTKECIHFVDTEEHVLGFGKRYMLNDKDHSNVPDWLWKFRGQLRVISTPHLPGKHYAVSPLQLLALVIHLEKLHRGGYFHGDICGYNVVFQDRKERPTYNYQEGNDSSFDLQGYSACLIDFDYAGPNDENLKYPQGYRQTLTDGFRIGEAGDTIVAHHEWVAMRHILFHLHLLVPPPDAPSDSLPNERHFRDRFA